MNASSGCTGLPLTKAANASMYSGLAAYSSGVKHQRKIPRMTISGTLPRPCAITCQLSTAALRKGSVLVHALWRDNDLILSGYFAARHIAEAAPTANTATWACFFLSACLNAAPAAER